MKTKSFNLFLTIFALLFIIQVNAQERIIHGVVTTFDSIPLNGATIKVNSTKQTVLTDSLGNFSIGCDKKDKLKVTANGFFPETVKLVSHSKLAAVNMRLKAGSKNLENAYGFTKAADRDKLGAMASKSNKELDLSGYTNLFDAIQGKFPGVSVEGTNLIIRGAGSINGPTPALIVLDGNYTSGPALNAVDLETIKRINVIKDGSAAVYGSRGAFGVVEITTKSGKK